MTKNLFKDQDSIIDNQKELAIDIILGTIKDYENELESNNVEVFTYDGSEISLKGAGGPTCLTRPIYRQR